MGAFLTSFTVRAQYRATVATLTVEVPVAGLVKASLMVTHERRIVLMHDLTLADLLSWHGLDLIRASQRWLGRDMGERGSFVEWLDWQARHGLPAPESAAVQP